jgi:hypothetical protein
MIEMTSPITFLSVTSVPLCFEFLDSCAERFALIRRARMVKHRGTENTETRMPDERLDRGLKAGGWFGARC